MLRLTLNKEKYSASFDYTSFMEIESEIYTNKLYFSISIESFNTFAASSLY